MSQSPSKKQHKIRNVLWSIAGGFAFIAVLFVVIGVTSGGGEAAPPRSVRESRPRVPDVETSAETLYLRYEANEARANREFKGKVLRVSGTVIDVTEQEVFGGFTISLKGNGGWANTLCRTKDADFAASLDKGQIVAVVGVGDGQFLGSPILKNCGRP